MRPSGFFRRDKKGAQDGKGAQEGGNPVLCAITRDDAFAVLNDIETELCALQDITDMLNHLPCEYTPPTYLGCCITAHVQAMRTHFDAAWMVILKGEALSPRS
ncbi:MAG: hypothetical protein COA45_01340 [Zetaproteobacteria bacterium]|nr:MAG: hypothetical protein COA45_01340 [Zetaproteobacteria bacterium]